MSLMPETSASASSVSSRRFGDLRGVQWRVDLGILPSSPSASIDDLRRVTANSRRSYAALRKQLLVDPHLPKDGSNSPDLVMDNPLSQDPDSMWSRFFRNAELERMVDQDLTRLYPERGGYFQTSGCQVMLRRILLLWCLKHPEYGYRQGMHELLAPLLYVLHLDVERLSEVRKAYEDHFADKFDGFSYHENNLTYNFDFNKFSEPLGDGNEAENSPANTSKPTEIDTATKTIVLLSDAYGAEGELGIVLSEKFMEHDAYAMFDALLSGMGGTVSMAEFFSPSAGSHSSPVIEASVSIYHFLKIVDSPLHTHLVELGVEPQYFSLRWLRVLFGREFSLEDLLLIWDEIFVCDNMKYNRAIDGNDADYKLGILDSPRGTFISAFAISMILQLRSSLLASDNATACLQKLLNFPEDANLTKMVAKAKSLQALAVNMNGSTSLAEHDERKPGLYKTQSSRDPMSPTTPLNVVPDSYWEEKWRVLHEEEERKRNSVEKRAKKGWSERVKLLRIHRRRASDPSSSKNKENDASVRINLIEDLSCRLRVDEGEVSTNNRDGFIDKKLSTNSSEENLPISTDSSSLRNESMDQENVSEGSSIASNSSVNENDVRSCEIPPAYPPLPVSDLPSGDFSEYSRNDEVVRKPRRIVKQRSRSLSDTFQWLWKFGKNGDGGMSDQPGVFEDITCNNRGNNDVTDIGSSGTSNGQTIDPNLIAGLRNLGQSMLENIQVIESVLQQQDRGQTGPPNRVTDKGQVAIQELRKISNLLSEM